MSNTVRVIDARVTEFFSKKSEWHGRASLNFDGDVHARRKIELFQFVHGLGGRVENVNQPLVRALFESFLRLLVPMRRALNGEALDAGRERDGAGDAGAGAFDGVGDFARRLVYDAWS